MKTKSKAISDDLYDQARKSLKKTGRDGEVGRRLQAIISAKNHGITAVAKIYSISRTTLMSWIRNFEKESIQGLRIKPGRGPKPKVSPEVKEDARAIINSNPNITIDHLRLKIMEKYDMARSKMKCNTVKCLLETNAPNGVASEEISSFNP